MKPEPMTPEERREWRYRFAGQAMAAMLSRHKDDNQLTSDQSFIPAWAAKYAGMLLAELEKEQAYDTKGVGAVNIELLKERSRNGWDDPRLCCAEDLPHGTWFETISGQMLRRLGWWHYTSSRILETRGEDGSPDLIRGVAMVLPYEFEDQIDGEITSERFAESRLVCGVRMYPKEVKE